MTLVMYRFLLLNIVVFTSFHFFRGYRFREYDRD